jgi:hypothetical protein
MDVVKIFTIYILHLLIRHSINLFCKITHISGIEPRSLLTLQPLVDFVFTTHEKYYNPIPKS